ncbi:MAG TPA: hypothetical protein VFQ61_23565, partial [Polyangiaceae bacterium]|nr:hypothetical protein [Polyangiaceae bacterium]
TTDQDVPAQLQGALDGAYISARGCNFALPSAPRPLDLNRVNLTLTVGSGAPAIVPGVKDAAACGAAPGWFYQSSSVSPNSIVLCEASCSALKSSPNAHLDILTGCETKVSN